MRRRTCSAGKTLRPGQQIEHLRLPGGQPGGARPLPAAGHQVERDHFLAAHTGRQHQGQGGIEGTAIVTRDPAAQLQLIGGQHRIGIDQAQEFEDFIGGDGGGIRAGDDDALRHPPAQGHQHQVAGAYVHVRGDAVAEDEAQVALGSCARRARAVDRHLYIQCHMLTTHRQRLPLPDYTQKRRYFTTRIPVLE